MIHMQLIDKYAKFIFGINNACVLGKVRRQLVELDWF
jgi:hypothetical protein